MGSNKMERADSFTGSESSQEITAPHDRPRRSIFVEEVIETDLIKSAPQILEMERRSSYRGEFNAVDLYKTLSKLQSQTPDVSSEEVEEINRLLTEMFGEERQAHSEFERTRHVGVIFKNLTVKGFGLGAAIQPTVSSPFNFFKDLFSNGPKGLKSKTPIRTLVNDFSGCIRPGEMILVLGRPGSGCSTFLKALANERSGFVDVSGVVTYGGTDAVMMSKKHRGEILYNPEDDLHYATLKVKDTLNFALKTKTPGKNSREEGESRQDYAKSFLRMVSKLFWIEHTLDTLVGDQYTRGVSGGEKKRVSIAEAMIARASLQCWDNRYVRVYGQVAIHTKGPNSTKGLDASTAREYIESLRCLTNMIHISTVAALYQVSEQLFHLFDKVLLIDGGECAYFGPTAKAADYFKELGFIQPDRWTTSDFLTSLADENERIITPGYERRIPRSSEQFGEIFRSSRQAMENFVEIDELEKETKIAAELRHSHETKNAKRKNYALPFHKQVMACTQRQALVMFNDKRALFGKWGGIGFQSLIIGSLFYNLSSTVAGAFTRGGVLFFILLFNSLMALAELTQAFQSRPILLKHKSFSFYRPAAYAIAQTVIDIPLVFIQVLLFDVVVYFMSGLQRTAEQFLTNLVILWIVTMTMYSFFRSIGALSSSLNAATRVTGVSIQALIVYTGYLIPPSKMRPWLGWIRRINPLQYAFEALMTNEFYNLELECVSPYLVPLVPGAIPQYQGCTIKGSTPGSTVLKGADYTLAAFGYKHDHLWRNVGIIAGFFIFFVFLTALGLERQKPNNGGGALTVFKRGETPRSVQKNINDPVESPGDEETGRIERSKIEIESNMSYNDQHIDTKLLRNDTIFTWTGVNYKIPAQNGTRTLLKDQQGYVKPGRLTALMGSSGAGKTTLLNILAQRITFGVVEGKFLVDGRPLPKSFQRSSGFAEQMDIHEPTATVREALRFSAKLRQPREVSVEEKYAYVEEVINLLEMEDIAGATIGVIGEGLNQEQRKRLTIGVELASKPELLMFLDEPTSGLDSGAASNIVRLLKKLATAGQAILVTIHQPSAVLFDKFDDLLLLKSGGRIVYHGELGQDSKHLLNYLERNGAKKCPPGMNPAEYMLEAIGAGSPDYKGPDWSDVWEQSEEKQVRTREIQQMIQDRRTATANAQKRDEREFAMPLSTQLSEVVKRTMTSYWRKPDYIYGKLILHIFTGLFNTFTFFRSGNSMIDMQSRLFSVFMTLTISPPLIQQLQPQYIALRDIYGSREANSKIYSWFAFAFAVQLAEIPYSVAAGTIYWCCWYWGVGFPWDTYTAASVWLFVVSFELFYVSLGQAIASFSPNPLLASLLVPIFFTFIVSFCGVVIPAVQLPEFWKSWMYPLTPFRWLFEGILGLVIHKVPVTCDTSELARFAPPPALTCLEYAGPYTKVAGGYVQTLGDGLCGICQFSNGDEFGASFSVFYKHVWRDYGIFWGYIVFNIAVVFICSWLYLQGGRKIVALVNLKVRKERKEQPQEQHKALGEEV